MSIRSRQGKAEVRARQATYAQDLVHQAEEQAAEWARAGGPPHWIQAKATIRHRAQAR